jgi:hypothetical protein
MRKYDKINVAKKNARKKSAQTVYQELLKSEEKVRSGAKKLFNREGKTPLRCRML